MRGNPETEPDTPSPSGSVRAFLLALIPLAGCFWILDIPRMVGVVLITEQYLAIVAALITAAAFLVYRGEGRLPLLLGATLAALSAGSWLWMSYQYPVWLLDAATRGPDKWMPGLIALVLLLEALRRATGLAIAILIGTIGLYGFLGHYLPGLLEASYTSPSRMIMYLYADSNGVPGLVLGVGSTVVLAFILFGSALRHAGGTTVFTDLALAAMGRQRGGAAKVAIVGSSVFGTLSGSTVGNVMSTGMVTIPLMKRFGFPKHYAAAVEAVASNGGQLAPPVMGATAFLIAEFMQISYTSVVLAALLPALVYYVVLFIQVDVYAKARGLEGLPADELPRAGEALKRGWIFLLPLFLLIYLLFFLGYSPGRAALYCAASTLALHLVATRRLHGPTFYWNLLVDTGHSVLPVLLICAAAGIVVGVINISGLGFTLTLLLAHVGEVAGILPLLLVTALLSIVLGMGMPTAGVYVLLSVLLAPALIRLGIPDMGAHLFIFYFGLLSMLTPPVAIASYAAGSIAGSPMWQTGMTALRLGAVAYLLPFIFAMNPALLMQGSLVEIGITLFTVIVSGYLLARGFVAQETRGGRALLSQALWLISGVALGFSTVVLGAGSWSAAALALISLAVGLHGQRLFGLAARNKVA
ncbi:MAG: TRAP transporter fused permease subunit [Aquisalimonadaceae bacterium]